LASSGGEARRLLNQGGGYVNGSRLASADTIINDNNIKDLQIVLRSGKKKFHKIRITR
jgi:tyrosyl-tRNA synthetase